MGVVLSILFYVIPAVVALLGMQYRFLLAFLATVFAGIAIYIGLGTHTVFAPLMARMLPVEYADGAGALAMIVVTLVVIGIFAGISVLCDSKMTKAAFPDGLDEIGGLFFGALSGFLVVNFLIFCFCVSPFRTKVDEKTLALMQNHSRDVLLQAVSITSYMTLQSNRTHEEWPEVFDKWYEDFKVVKLDEDGNVIKDGEGEVEGEESGEAAASATAAATAVPPGQPQPTALKQKLTEKVNRAATPKRGMPDPATTGATE